MLQQNTLPIPRAEIRGGAFIFDKVIRPTQTKNMFRGVPIFRNPNKMRDGEVYRGNIYSIHQTRRVWTRGSRIEQRSCLLQTLLKRTCSNKSMRVHEVRASRSRGMYRVFSEF